MKKFRFLAAFVALATLLGLTSCSNDPTELLNGGQGTEGTTTLNVNYAIPGDSTKVFRSTYVSANVNGSSVVITAENEDTGETLEISFVGNKVQKDNQASYGATVTYTDASGNEYESFSPFSNSQTGALRLKDINTEKQTISGVFSFIGFDSSADEAADGVPFFSGSFMEVPYTGTLPEPTYITATVDSTDVDFEVVSTLKPLDTVTAFKGTNTDPKLSFEMKFTNSADIVQGATVELGDKLKVDIKIDDVIYIAKSGSVKFNTVSETTAIGTFSFTASTEDNAETSQIKNGTFKMLLE